MKTLYWKDWSKNKNFFFLIHMYVRGIRFYFSKFSNSNYPILQGFWNLCSKICWIHSFLHIFRKMNFFSILFFLFGSQYISIIPITAVFFEQFFFLHSRQGSQPIRCVHLPHWLMAAFGEKYLLRFSWQ